MLPGLHLCQFQVLFHLCESLCFTIIKFHTGVCSREADDPYEDFISDQGSKVAMQALSDQKLLPKVIKSFISRLAMARQ